MKYIFTIILISISVNIFAQKSLKTIKDNWFDAKGNWVLTVTDNSIIYKNAFWDYEVESATRKQILLQTINGEEFQRMSFSLLDESNMKFALGATKESLILSKDRQVKFPTQNNKINYQPDKVTINGYVKNFQDHYECNSINLGFGNWLTGTYSELFTEIDSSGFFSISFYQPFPVEFSISYRKRWIRLFMVPGETLTVFLDADAFPKNVLAMGQHADIAYNIAEFEKHSGRRTYENSKLHNKKNKTNAADYKMWRDSLKEEDIAYANDYFSKKDCSDFFEKWLYTNYEYTYIMDIAENYSSHMRKNKTAPLDSSYLALLDSIDFNDTSNVTHGKLVPLINRYTNIYYSLAQARPETKGVTKYFTDNGKSNPEISLNNAELNPNTERVAKYRRDAVSVDEYIKEVENVKNELLRDALIAQSYDRYKGYYTADSLALNIYSHLETDMAKDKFRNEYLNEKHLIAELNSINTNVDEGQELLNQITDKHKNKVIYVDFWGVHCGPCLSDFEYAKNIKTYFSDKDVVFVYLCQRGGEKRWEEVIDKYQVIGDHYLLTDRQQVALTKKFNISGVPRYVLIDKYGKVVDYDAPRPLPYSESELKVLIKKYL